MLTLKRQRSPFEFQRTGPLARPPGGHKPDFNYAEPNVNTRSINQDPNKKTIKTKSRPVVLDTLFLVDNLGTSHFERFNEIDASSKKLNAVDLTALGQLTSIEKADFSDNTLPLEPFAILPKLTDLDLSCNSLKTFDFKSSETMSGDEPAWPCLVNLNLSFNNCSRSITDLQLIPHLTVLNLSHNGLTSLPSNLMHFTCLTTLDLSGNMLNSESSFFSLATIQSLQTLVLDKNEIFHIPKFQFGFEALAHISLRQNRIELPDDITSLADLELLEDVNIAGNPLVLRSKLLPVCRQTFASSNIDLKTEDPPRGSIKAKAFVPLNPIPLDPLTLPSFTKQHQRALNRKTRVVIEEEQDDGAPPPEDDVFMTAFGSKADDGVMSTDALSPAGELAGTSEEAAIALEEAPPITSVWAEVPVVQLSRRKKLTQRARVDFVTAYKKLEFLVAHPDLRVKPRESQLRGSESAASTTSSKEVTAPERQSLPSQSEMAKTRSSETSKSRTKGRRKPEVAQQLAARTEYTKSEIKEMLASMSDRLSVVERDLHVTDESGQTAVDIALDQRNFAELHKKYESIRAELVNTLNS